MPSIAIIGAGFGGLATALELRDAGIDNFTIFERASEVGGVWHANTYPGAACDVPSVIYQFSRHLKADWSRRYGTQPEIRDYLREVSIETGIRGRIRFNTEIVEARFDEAGPAWDLQLADGATERFDILVCANGQLSRPRFPDGVEREGFAGPQFHSAQWDHSVDLANKRVVVVGGGASAIQVVPAIADQVARLTVVQRTPSWIVDKYDWSPSLLEKGLMRRFPAVQRAYHQAMWWWFEVRYPLVLRRTDPLRRVWEAYRRAAIRRVVRDPAKVAACTPHYALGCNRVLLSRDWYPTIARADVDVIAEGVAAVKADAVVTASGREVPADVVIWCTGFTATEYLAPMRVIGAGGLDVREAWADGPEAYLGLAAPGFPNLFLSYGPNTNSLTNTITSMLEYQASYIRQAIEQIARTGAGLEVRREVHDAFNRELQERLGHTVFTTGCPGWYTTDEGKVTTVWVGSHVEYRRRTRHFDPVAYERIEPLVAPAVSTNGASPVSAAEPLD